MALCHQNRQRLNELHTSRTHVNVNAQGSGIRLKHSANFPKQKHFICVAQARNGERERGSHVLRRSTTTAAAFIIDTRLMTYCITASLTQTPAISAA